MKNRQKSRLEKFYPDQWLESAYTIPYQEWYDKGKRGLIYDVDNTLVPHGAPATKESIELFRRLHAMGFQTLLISNNRKARVEPFAKAMETDYISMANKPFEASYHKGCRKMGLKEDQVLFIGDQLFTDVWGAKKAGIFSILVDPINPKEEIQIVLKRRLEKIVLRKFLEESGQKRKLGR